MGQAFIITNKILSSYLELAGGTGESIYTLLPFCCGLSHIQYSGIWELQPGQASYLTEKVVQAGQGKKEVFVLIPSSLSKLPPSTLLFSRSSLQTTSAQDSNTVGCFSHVFQDCSTKLLCNTFPYGSSLFLSW